MAAGDLDGPSAIAMPSVEPPGHERAEGLEDREAGMEATLGLVGEQAPGPGKPARPDRACESPEGLVGQRHRHAARHRAAGRRRCSR